ncbi:MAG: histone deacetylase family protein [Dehalococcoidia bacterium]|nr:histone deacetylase family protein [Dehalococcoidia bacterium]
MFRIRRIYDDVTHVNREAIAQVQAILRAQFPGLSEKDISKVPKQLRNPMKYRFRAILFIAEDSKLHVKGFALLFHEPTLQFCFLDYISTVEGKMGRGIGGALYERIRQEALSLRTLGLFFECLPDDPALSRDPAIRRQNGARLRFYERYGARPIANTAYATPLKSDGDNPPYLVFDDLGQGIPLRRQVVRDIVRIILEQKYGEVCSADYIEGVIDSFKDDPIRLRSPRYVRKAPLPTGALIPVDKRIALTINDRHAIHHVRDIGYVEAPVRIDSILAELEPTSLFLKVPTRHFSERYIKASHDDEFVNYFKRVCENLEPDESIYPYVFPIRNVARPPKELPVRAGYYCIDTFTPLNRNAYVAAARATDCALTLAEEIVQGRRLAYALVRPPGHHAERRSFGGFCYLNSSAIAAEYLSVQGKTAILDLDYHHGNGQQDIFYARSDVLTISIHGHPRFAYPYFSGFRDEKGVGPGYGYNVNFPLSETIDSQRYRKVLAGALRRIHKFNPVFLVLALGFDTAKGDPTGTWSLEASDFGTIGEMIGALRIPTLVVQEGGYDTHTLGINARHFFSGLWEGMYGQWSLPLYIGSDPDTKGGSGNRAGEGMGAGKIAG